MNHNPQKFKAGQIQSHILYNSCQRKVLYFHILHFKSNVKLIIVTDERIKFKHKY